MNPRDHLHSHPASYIDRVSEWQPAIGAAAAVLGRCANGRAATQTLDAVCGLPPLVEAINAVAIISVTDVAGKIVFANSMFERISGYNASDLIGRTHRILGSGLHDKALFEEMWRTISNGSAWHGELRNLSKDGRHYWVDTAIVPFRNKKGRIAGYVSVRVDISDRKATVERLRAQGSALAGRLELALDCMGRGLALFDAEGRLILSNKAFREAYALPPESVRVGDSYEQISLRCREPLLNETSPANGFEEVCLGRRDDRHRHGIAATTIHRSANGRSIQITRHSLPDGGWADLHEDITERLNRESVIAHLARHDALTDLPNRILFGEELELALARNRTGVKLAVHVVDLDGFKAVNETFGQSAGDDVLKILADRLRDCARDVGLVARIGGCEFSVLQSDIQTADEARKFAQRMVSAVSEPIQWDGHDIAVGANIGISLAPSDAGRGSDLIRLAGLALYRAKEQGRGTYSFHEPNMQARQLLRHRLEMDIGGALSSHQLELHYQAIAKTADRRILGAEALMRWVHPELGLVSPAEFIPAAERTGAIVELGAWAIKRALQDAAKWHKNLKVAVNLSTIQFIRPGLLKVVTEALAESGVSPSRLELEITESVVLGNVDAVLESLQGLRSLGVRIALDDFGTGYSSLSYLHKFPFDKIKIDKSFISDLGRRQVSCCRFSGHLV